MSKKFNQFEIYAPVSPCAFVSKKSEKTCRIDMSAGGGMGGSHWKEYGQIIKGDPMNGGFIVIKDAITKVERTINTRFIVSIEEVQVMKVVWNTTDYANYNNKTCEKQTRTLYFWFPKDAKVNFNNKYGDKAPLNNYLIKEIIEED
jgi:hypothetical protein